MLMLMLMFIAMLVAMFGVDVDDHDGGVGC